jgi:urea transport system ATP-binding protein
MSYFSVANLTTGYSSGSSALHNVSLEIPQGEVCAVIGSNGAGKSTLLKAIMGILPNHSASLTLGGELLQNLSTEERARRGIAYVPQGRMIFPYLTVDENLGLGCEVRKMNVKKAKERAYGFFPALADIRGRKGGMLSGGQQQQLAIARMLAIDPKLLLLDEPAEGIQPNVVQEIGRILKKVSAEMGITVLLVEQFVAFALKHADSYYWMQGGEILKSGPLTPENLGIVMAGISL